MALNDRYEIAETAAALALAGKRAVALQFPDGLLHEAVVVCERLQASLGTETKVFVLGDTSYGSCCVDETAAEHMQADIVVHYGPSCLSLTSRIPAQFVFGREPLQHEPLVSALRSRFPPDQPLAVLFALAYAHSARRLHEALSAVFSRSSVARAPPQHCVPIAGGLNFKTASDQRPSAATATAKEPTLPHNQEVEVRVGGLLLNLPPGVERLSECTVVYIGGEGPRLTSLLLRLSPSLVLSYLPASDGGPGCLREESAGTNRALARRYHLVERARAADIFGILVGTLGVAGYTEAIEATRALVAAAGRKSYTFVVGKPNPPKLANFPEVDAFVLVACEESTLVDSKELLRPVITPFELLAALAPSWRWTGEYSTSFAELIPEIWRTAEALRRGEGSRDGEEPLRMSLATGRMLKERSMPAAVEAEAEAGAEGGALLPRAAAGALSAGAAGPAAEFLQGRTFRGLEMRLGADAPQLATEGRSGIASKYTDES